MVISHGLRRGDRLGDLAQGLVLYGKIKRLELMKCMKARGEREEEGGVGETLTGVIQIKLEAYEKCVLFRSQMHMDRPLRRQETRRSHMKRKLRRLSFRNPRPNPPPPFNSTGENHLQVLEKF